VTLKRNMKIVNRRFIVDILKTGLVAIILALLVFDMPLHIFAEEEGSAGGSFTVGTPTVTTTVTQTIHPTTVTRTQTSTNTLSATTTLIQQSTITVSGTVIIIQTDTAQTSFVTETQQLTLVSTTLLHTTSILTSTVIEPSESVNWPDVIVISVVVVLAGLLIYLIFDIKKLM
jgi:hypothetical protein